MNESTSQWFTGVCLLAGLLGLGWLIGDAFVGARELERTVTVKGLAEREVDSNVAIWPLPFVVADNELSGLYAALENKNRLVVEFLREQGFTDEDISVNPPAIVDQKATGYRDPNQISFRYSSTQVVTVYTNDVDKVRAAQRQLIELGKRGVAIAGDPYQYRTEFLFTGLNDIKPAMIEQATLKAREVAAKFAADSGSRLGKIRKANQGQFSISDRDSNTPHIKRVRVVSTIEYYLDD